MRLALPLLIAALLSMHARTQSSLPWKRDMVSPYWRVKSLDSTLETNPVSVQSTRPCLPLVVHLSANGTIKVVESGGLVRWRLGLPGRPKKVWRDSGIRVAEIFSPISFPARSPLQRGVGNMLLNILDFRPNLKGLLWILDDDESILTVINPATSQVVYIRLPTGQNLAISLHAKQIEVFEEQCKDCDGSQTGWTLHWLALLPQFIQLAGTTTNHHPQHTILPPVTK